MLMLRNTFCTLLFCVLGAINLKAQTYSLGLATAYGDDIETFGIHTRAYVNSKNQRFCAGPEFTYFLKSSHRDGSDLEERELFEVNLNMHFIFELSHHFGFYPLMGLNYSNERASFYHNDQLDHEELIRKWGLNLGGGFHYMASPNWIIFIEFDHLFSELSQNNALLGVFYTFGQGFVAHDQHH